MESKCSGRCPLGGGAGLGPINERVPETWSGASRTEVPEIKDARGRLAIANHDAWRGLTRSANLQPSQIRASAASTQQIGCQVQRVLGSPDTDLFVSTHHAKYDKEQQGRNQKGGNVCQRSPPSTAEAPTLRVVIGRSRDAAQAERHTKKHECCRKNPARKKVAAAACDEIECRPDEANPGSLKDARTKTETAGDVGEFHDRGARWCA